MHDIHGELLLGEPGAIVMELAGAWALVMVLNLMIGLLHPPLGMVLFVLARISKLSVERTTVAIMPWLIPLFLSLIAITYIPEISLWLPQMMQTAK